MTTNDLPEWILREGDYLYIVNHDHKFIYYQTPKCGSRTINNIMRLSQDETMLGDEPRGIDKEYHEKYYTFGFVRNPWDRLVSNYINKIVDKYQHGLFEFRLCKSFDSFIHRIEKVDLVVQDRHIQPQYMFLPEDINFIGRMENFRHDIGIICNTIDIQLPDIPHKNKSKHKHYTEYYNDETRQIVAEKYAKDIEYFGYKFGE